MSDPSTSGDNLASLSYHQLQKECGKSGLSAIGKTEVLRKRLHEHLTNQNVEAVPVAKRQKTPSPSDDLICPITLALPFDPVVAEDGKIYERSAIEEYFSTNPGATTVNSPVAGRLMGKQLFPAPWVKGHIESLIAAGVIQGELAATWNETMQRKKDWEELLKRAEQGDPIRMCAVAYHYRCGSENVKQDVKMAYKWFERAHSAGNPIATANIGAMLLGGKTGVSPTNKQKATTYLALAAERGSDYAAFVLGTLLAKGRHGLPVDVAEARRLLEKCVSGTCGHRTLDAEAKVKARELLDSLRN